MLRVILVDDEPPALRGMRQLLGDHQDIAIVGEAEGLAEAVALARDVAPDVVFLDVTLADGEGFALLPYLDPRPRIVLVTASAAHAVRAFEIGAIDFLLKPVDPERLAVTMGRLRHAQAGSGSEAIAATAAMRSGRIVLSEGSDTVRLALEDIGLLSAEADFTRILLVDGRDHLVCRRLGQFEDELPSPPFARLGRSVMVNLDHVERIEGRGGDGALVHVAGLLRPVTIGRAATQRLRRAIAAIDRDEDQTPRLEALKRDRV